MKWSLAPFFFYLTKKERGLLKFSNINKAHSVVEYSEKCEKRKKKMAVVRLKKIALKIW